MLILFYPMERLEQLEVNLKLQLYDLEFGVGLFNKQFKYSLK